MLQEASELRQVYTERDQLQFQIDALNAEVTVYDHLCSKASQIAAVHSLVSGCHLATFDSCWTCYRRENAWEMLMETDGMQITELREAKAETEGQRNALSKELQVTKDILHMRNAMLHRNQCDQQVQPSAVLSSQLLSSTHRHLDTKAMNGSI